MMGGAEGAAPGHAPEPQQQPESARVYTREQLGAFVQGWWTPGANVRQLEFDDVEVGERLGPAPWTFKPVDAALIAYLGDTSNPWYVERGPNGEPVAPLTTAIWASFSLLHTSFAWGVIVDYRHEMRWHRPLPGWTDTVLEGEISEAYEKRGMRFLQWRTRCAAASDGDLFFEVEHTILPEPPGSAT